MPDQVCVPSVLFSRRFLAMLKAPEHTRKLTFTIEAGGLLLCKAVYYTDVRDETAEKEWEVRLPRTSTFYQLLTGDIS